MIDKAIPNRMDYELLSAYRDNRYGGNKRNAKRLIAELRRRGLIGADGELTNQANIVLMGKLAS